MGRGSAPHSLDPSLWPPPALPSFALLSTAPALAGPYCLSRAPERVLLHKGQMVSSKAPQDLLGLSPKPSGAPGWEGVSWVWSELELEAEGGGERGVTKAWRRGSLAWRGPPLGGGVNGPSHNLNQASFTHRDPARKTAGIRCSAETGASPRHTPAVRHQCPDLGGVQLSDLPAVSTGLAPGASRPGSLRARHHRRGLLASRSLPLHCWTSPPSPQAA